jgi:hypothetical protein
MRAVVAPTAVLVAWAGEAVTEEMATTDAAIQTAPATGVREGMGGSEAWVDQARWAAPEDRSAIAVIYRQRLRINSWCYEFPEGHMAHLGPED